MKNIVAGTLHFLGDVDHLQTEAHIWRVRSIFGESLLHRDPWEGCLKLGIEDLLPNVRVHALDGGEYVLLFDERHLHIELGELRLPVGARILIAKATRQLVIAFYAPDHQHLLVKLG